MRTNWFYGTLIAFTIITANTMAEDQYEHYSNEKLNFTVTYAKEWHEVQSPSAQITLVLQKDLDTAILVAGGETELTLETQIAVMKNEIKMNPKSVRLISQYETTVAGENAVMLKSAVNENGVSMTRYVAVFMHQDIAYRVVGVAVNDNLEFITAYSEFLSGFAFKGSRKDWHDKLQGTPTSVIMLGGLASLEINQPRWIERPEQIKRNNDAIEQTEFRMGAGGGWLNLLGVDTHRSQQEELDEAVRLQSVLLKDFQITPVAKASGIQCSSATIVGDATGIKRTMRVAVMVEDGIAFRAVLECLDSRHAETEKDWQQLLRSLKLRKKSDPKNAPAYTFPEPYKFADVDSSPALDAVIGAATRIKEEVPARSLRAVSVDGKLGLFTQGKIWSLENFETHERTPLKPLGADYSDAISFSPDSKKVIWASSTGVHIVTLADGTEKVLQSNAREAVFAGNSEELLVAESVASKTHQNFRDLTNRVETSTLQRIKVADESRTTLISFPLSNTKKAVISPDSKRIALICNRDDARTKSEQIYTCNADGSNLKKITQGDLKFSKLAWSSNGKELYAFGGQSEKQNYFSTTASDLYRIPLETGIPVNLSRCEKIAGVWFIDDSVVLTFYNYDLSTDKQGVYRISCEKLEQATHALPIPAHASAATIASKISESVTAAFGGKSVDAVVPGAETIAKAAQAFADAAGPATNANFDYSPDSLARLSSLLSRMRSDGVPDRAFFLGAGAYYGETLRKIAGAEWKLKPIAFGQWLPGIVEESNSLVNLKFPFSDIHGEFTFDENRGLETTRSIKEHANRPKIILVYPPSAAHEMLTEATDPDYLNAFKHLDAGEIDKAGELLTKVMVKHPHNRNLALEVIEICEAAGLPDLARTLVRRAVEDGNEVTELLLRYANEVTLTNPTKAKEIYRRATKEPFASAEVFIKLGEIYAGEKQMDLARSCWRRGCGTADPQEKITLCKLIVSGWSPDAAQTGNENDDPEE